MLDEARRKEEEELRKIQKQQEVSCAVVDYIYSSMKYWMCFIFQEQKELLRRQEEEFQKKKELLMLEEQRIHQLQLEAQQKKVDATEFLLGRVELWVPSDHGPCIPVVV